VLCRFDDGTAPDRRFQRAEVLGIAADLDLAIIDVAVSELPEVDASYVSLNLSPSTLRDRRLGDVLLHPRVPAERIVIEVTERARITDYEAAEQLIAALRAGGVRLAVDDAGAGYATLRHMLSLQPDFIKMDRSITEDVDSDTARHVLATALVTFAAEIGAILIAEGVETPGEILGLRRAGISQAQGYVLARPTSLPLAGTDYQPAPVPGESGTPPERRGLSGRLVRAASGPASGEEPARARALRKLHEAMQAVQAAESALEDSVALGRNAGVSWDEIAETLGMTRQGASKRFGRGRLY
jgi:EAL domain-containing protein (putative c-di-GMP-specific phosphodiesterase class I)